MVPKGKVFVIGVGMTKVCCSFFDCIVFKAAYFQFEKPGSRPNFDYPDMVHEAVTKALNDCSLSYQDIQQAAVGYIYGTSRFSYLTKMWIIQG